MVWNKYENGHIEKVYVLGYSGIGKSHISPIQFQVPDIKVITGYYWRGGLEVQQDTVNYTGMTDIIILQKYKTYNVSSIKKYLMDVHITNNVGHPQVTYQNEGVGENIY